MRTLICLVFTALFAAPASAAPFTWLVEGTITHNLKDLGFPSTPYTDALPVGQAYSWAITMESTSPDYDPNPGCGFYNPITAMTFTSGSVSLSTTSKPSQDYLFGTGGNCFLGNTIRLRSNFGGLFFSMHLGYPFVTDALPLTIDHLGYASLDLSYAGLPPYGTPVANASVTSIRTVPEPVTAVLMLSGLLSALGARRRRRAAR
jgi:hypothetical protein